MIAINESTRDNPTKLICECGQEVGFALHHDYLEGRCVCEKEYQIKVGATLWNCCAVPANPSI